MRSAISVPGGLLGSSLLKGPLGVLVFGGSSRRFASEGSSWRSRLRRVFPTLRFRKFFLAVRRSFSVLSSSAGLPDASLPKVLLVRSGRSSSLSCCFVVVTLPFSFVWSVNWPDLDFFYQDLSMSYSPFGKPRSLGAM